MTQEEIQIEVFGKIEDITPGSWESEVIKVALHRDKLGSLTNRDLDILRTAYISRDENLKQRYLKAYQKDSYSK